MRTVPYDILPENDALFGRYNQVMYGVPSPRFNPQPSIGFVRTRQPDPGMDAYAYDSLGLVEFTYIGPAVANRQQFRSLQPAQMFAGLGVIKVGIGGPNAGTMALTSLGPNVWNGSNPVL